MLDNHVHHRQYHKLYYHNLQIKDNGELDYHYNLENGFYRIEADKDKIVGVVGGGNSAVGNAIYLSAICR